MYDLLNGIRVVEVSMYAFGPSAGGVLADWGADVIKIVHPEYGDPMQGNPVGDLPKVDVDVAFMWEICNRGKRCIGLDLQNGDSREPFEALIATADVFVTSFLPATRSRLAIELEDVRAIRQDVVYARASGHGVRGPEREKGGYDHTSFWARTGLAHAASMPFGELVPQPGPALGDLMAGMSLAGAIASALVRRERTGQGAVVDVSLLSTGAYMFSPSVVASALYGVPTIPRYSHAKQPNPLVAGYETRDGRLIYFAGMRTDQHWKDLCGAIGNPALASDPRFVDGSSRLEHNEECIAELDAVFSTRTLVEWTTILNGISTPWAVVQSAEEARGDPQVKANDYIVDVTSEGGSVFPLVVSPAQFDEGAPVLRRAPGHGEHTDEVLLELGLTWDQIIGLKTSGAVL